MKTFEIEIPVKPSLGKISPLVSSLKLQSSSALLCGMLFADQSLWRIELGTQGELKNAENLKLEDFLGEKVWGVMGGLQPSLSGDTAFSVLHTGIFSGAFSFLGGGSLASKSLGELKDFFIGQDGGVGLALRHSVLQYSNGEFSVRRSKEPGALLDTYCLGENVFGLSPSGIWKEPYLKPDKREMLRSDLLVNWALHRGDDGTLWFVGRDSRLYRFMQGDIKALPSRLKLRGQHFEQSAASSVGNWLYGLGENSELFRVRRNPISSEDELQQILAPFGNVVAIACADQELVGEDQGVSGCLAVLVEKDHQLALWAASLVATEDAEDLGDVPVFQKVGEFSKLQGARALQLKSLGHQKFVAFTGGPGLGSQVAESTLRLWSASFELKV